MGPIIANEMISAHHYSRMDLNRALDSILNQHNHHYHQQLNQLYQHQQTYHQLLHCHLSSPSSSSPPINGHTISGNDHNANTTANTITNRQTMVALHNETAMHLAQQHKQQQQQQQHDSQQHNQHHHVELLSSSSSTSPRSPIMNGNLNNSNNNNRSIDCGDHNNTHINNNNIINCHRNPNLINSSPSSLNGNHSKLSNLHDNSIQHIKLHKEEQPLDLSVAGLSTNTITTTTINARPAKVTALSKGVNLKRKNYNSLKACDNGINSTKKTSLSPTTKIANNTTSNNNDNVVMINKTIADKQIKSTANPNTIKVSNGTSGSKSNSKNYSCNDCGRSFARSDMLTRHSRLHSGVKPYRCKQCNQVFSRSDHLSTHERTHTGEKPYQCQRCTYSACRRDMITRHMRTHARRNTSSSSSSSRSTSLSKTSLQCS